MRDSVILELTNRWYAEAAQAENSDKAYSDDQAGAMQCASDKSERETLRRCADTLRLLVKTIGEVGS